MHATRLRPFAAFALVLAMLGATFAVASSPAEAAPNRDLQTYHITPEKADRGDIIDIEAGVMNTGPQDAHGVNIKVQIKGVKHVVQSFDLPGCTLTVVTSSSSRLDCPFGTMFGFTSHGVSALVKLLGAGTLMITTTADPNNTVKESNEGNNVSSIDIPVRQHVDLEADYHFWEEDFGAGEEGGVLFHFDNDGNGPAKDILVEIRVTGGLPLDIVSAKMEHAGKGRCEIVSPSTVKCYLRWLHDDLGPNESEGDDDFDVEVRYRASDNIPANAEYHGTFMATISSAGANGEVKFENNSISLPVRVFGPPS